MLVTVPTDFVTVYPRTLNICFRKLISLLQRNALTNFKTLVIRSYFTVSHFNVPFFTEDPFLILILNKKFASTWGCKQLVIWCYCNNSRFTRTKYHQGDSKTYFCWKEFSLKFKRIICKQSLWSLGWQLWFMVTGNLSH